MKAGFFFGLLLVCGLVLVAGNAASAQQAVPPPGDSGFDTGGKPDPAATSATMTDIHDIKPPVAIPVWPMWPRYLLVVLAVLLAAGLGLWFWRRAHRAAEAVRQPPPIPPEVTALEALQRLAADRQTAMDGQTFYFRLSAILRNYVDQRFQLGASQMTTEEFVPRVETLDLARDLKRPLVTLCQGADPIKFAKAEVRGEKMQSDLAFVQDFVKQTTPHV